VSQPIPWRSYEEVTQQLLGRIAEHFDPGRQADCFRSEVRVERSTRRVSRKMVSGTRNGAYHKKRWRTRFPDSRHWGSVGGNNRIFFATPIRRKNHCGERGHFMKYSCPRNARRGDNRRAHAVSPLGSLLQCRCILLFPQHAWLDTPSENRGKRREEKGSNLWLVYWLFTQMAVR
jgi:hypothetical protein